MASDYLLEIDGIKGESQDDKHKDTIEISSFSWGASNTGASSSGSGGGAGKVSFQDISFTTSVNKSSPLLMLACASGQHIKKAVLYVRKQGGDQMEFYTITLEDVVVTSYKSGGHVDQSSTIPVDQFTLDFTTIKYEYKPQKADGSLDSAQSAGWNVKTNKKA
jgi:type VI secretion system secreted protein Hcp